MPKTVASTAEVPWSQFNPPIRVGDRIRSIYGHNERMHGHGEGQVVQIGRGYPEHECPDHQDEPDCICGGEGGRVEAMQPYPVVAYPDRERCISPEDEGERWERLS